MAVLEVVTDDHPALKRSCKKIRKMTDELRQLAGDMLETLEASGNGVGLAANQVARNIRMIAVWDGEEGVDIYINPKIAGRSGMVEYDTEGCLSFPTLFGTVGRDGAVEIHARDIDMKKVKVTADGFRARIFQHEIDHLNGITFLERVEDGTLREIVPCDPEEEAAEESEGRLEHEAAGADTAGGDAAEEARAAAGESDPATDDMEPAAAGPDSK